MYSRRLLFVRGPPWSGLAPILVALLSLVALALLGLVIALWPPSPRSPVHPASGEAAPTQRSYEGGLSVPVNKRESAARTRGI